jgi:DNA-binding response OmpR family regulator
MSGVYAKKILIIENDPTISDPLIAGFARMGYETFLSFDSNVVISGITQLHPDAIILDIAMEGVDGFSLFESLRALPDPAIAATPVVVVSTTGDIAEISRAIKLNIKDYFLKTEFDPAVAITKVMRIFGDAHDGATIETSLSPETMETKVLIVEDDKFLRDLAVQKLEKEHLHVYAAMDGEQGVALAEEHAPSLILLDILLPGIDGFEVLKRIRANTMFDKTHVVMLSNFGQREDLERAFAAGADKFLVKANYTLDEIVQEVKKVLASPRTPGLRKE